MKQKAILECTVCGRRLHRRIWTSITIGSDRVTEDKIFNDEINFFACDRCDNEGFAWYPIKIKNRDAGEKAMVLPTDTDGFDVIEVGEKNSCRVFYDFASLKWEIYGWQGGYKTFFDPPPEEEDIKEALQKNILSKEDADILRQTDWEAFFDDLESENIEVDWTEEQEKSANIYMKFMYELDMSRKIIQLKK